MNSGRGSNGRIAHLAGCGTGDGGRGRAVRSGRGVLGRPIGNGVQSFRSHGLLDAAVFGGRTRRAVLEEMVQTRQFGGLKIMVAAVLQGFLDFSEILLRRDLTILLTGGGKHARHGPFPGWKGLVVAVVTTPR